MYRYKNIRFAAFDAAMGLLFSLVSETNLSPEAQDLLEKVTKHRATLTGDGRIPDNMTREFALMLREMPASISRRVYSRIFAAEVAEAHLEREPV